MSKDHAYAYEAGYRDGSVHYELEHCPACKNVADLQEALEENATLRKDLEFANNGWEKDSIEFLNLQAENAVLHQQLADVTVSMGRLEERCAKLREMCGELADELHALGVDFNRIGWCFLRDDLRELGVEVDA